MTLKLQDADIANVMGTLDALAGISEKGEGVTRLAYSKEENDAHVFLRKYMASLGMATRTDSAGNLYGTIKGFYTTRIIVGSHADSVPNGGRYDGTLGIAMGIEAARALKDAGLKHSLEIVVFRAEESSRFKLSSIGSKLVTGFLNAEELKERSDGKGISAYDAMTASGSNPKFAELWDKSSRGLYIEPHIEQADNLLDAGIPIGVVTVIRAPIRYMLKIEGRWAHSGATPMRDRKDANAGASEMTLAVERIAKEYERRGCETVATAAPPTAEGWAINKVTGEVQLPIDIRGAEEAECNDLAERILKECGQIAERRGLSLSAKLTERGTPAKLREEDYSILEKAAESLGVRSRRMQSGAGHDAQYISLYGIPTIVMFVRNSGLSHNPYESVERDDIKTATELLIETIRRADEQ